ncbi:solute carrier family 2, facilitated glucose transporter member 6 isoform X1 [Zalophus californianus]|uniref:Solute carrier family 2, facilitated glucose transporter member 6 n=2 Tax=Zalophus californianus TaxID=9704 RepID=A0A6J2EML5_ZALCA|nr:solute carrier family 2, facilitated glucose transporter member 6 isoform X1 [Zalophus californianus]XP_027470246.1 solute carrier family 2, facilitated glucose transporter member 6 isoform X1 [Zalophus californianus]XP_027949210.1 solute carrier family 2, facilitated glucose transporter member 6 isoform X1 [Eumetopias jubatus]XP_027949212.1 solute carrier family 2, facilitated glucose transporter member 6 isoform X1 [Eumetopias jubatus]
MQEPLLGAEGPDYDTFPEKSPSPGERTRVGAPQNKRVFLATFAAVLGNFSFGYALVYTSPVIPALEHSLDPDLSLTKTQASWFGSVFTLGAAAGGLSAMVLNDLLGRKLSIMFSAVPSAAGYALMAGAHGFWMLLLGRTLTGFAGGLTAACIPVYVSEIATPSVRGALGATPQLMAVFGSLSLYALGLLLPWRWLAVAGEGPVLIMILLLSFMPNSPRFLLSRGRDTEALRALAWLRGADTDVRWEFQQIQDNIRRQSTHMSWAEARNPHMYRPILIALLMRFLQQLMGITPILVYLQPIFESTAVLLPPKDDAAIVGAVRLFSVLIAALTMDLAGRKVLLFISATIMFAANLTLGLYVHLGPKPLTPNSTMSTMGLQSVPLGDTEQPLATPSSYLTLLPLVATMLFIMGYAMGWGPITWLLMSEILPLQARGVASGLCVLVSWLTAFALTKSFLLVVNAFGLHVPFFFFAAICLASLVFTGCWVPETKGRSLEQIESFFRTGRRSFLH